MPYRDWCPHCVAARGLGEQRGRHTGRPHDVPRVGLDYWFITSGGDLRRRKGLKEDFPEGEDGEAKLEQARAELKIMKCIAIRCHESKAVFAHSVPVKGRGEDNYVSEFVAADVQFMGHVKVIIKTENEPAPLALATGALLNIRIDVQKDQSSLHAVSLEHSAEHESQSN